MITFKKLGNLGRLGNQLFQIASTIGIALDNNQDYIFPHWKYSRYFQNPINQSSIFELDKFEFEYIDLENTFEWVNISLKQESNYNLNSYFQSEKYFINYKDTINNIFLLKDKYISMIQSKYGEILQKKTCSIHVRRGDYLDLTDCYNILDLDYYYQATSLFKDHIFLVFSDDILWCKENIKLKNCIFIENQEEILDLFLMSLCKNNIIANSSFSWWGAWLNKNGEKIIIAPKKWFGPKLEKNNTKDLIPDNWIKI